MKTVCFIRHGATAGNREKRYIGCTDEPLCGEGKARAAALKSAGLPAFDRVFISPYLRCRETASILFPGRDFTVTEGLRECDFGMFEGKTALELTDCAEYAAWLASGCTAPVPGGESVEGFKARCRKAFLSSMAEISENGVCAFVIHGGSIMALLEAYAAPRRAFYEYRVEPCGLVRCAFDGETLKIEGTSLCC